MFVLSLFIGDDYRQENLFFDTEEARDSASNFDAGSWGPDSFGTRVMLEPSDVRYTRHATIEGLARAQLMQAVAGSQLQAEIQRQTAAVGTPVADALG